jgi:putative lipoic acid-binding regulatory protein
MSNDKIFLLHCSVSASVRQSTQIKMADLQLPDTVIDVLEKQQSVSVRPTLSGKLKEFLNLLRIEQRKLYDECTIHNGDVHFLHEDYFEEAMQRIAKIRSDASNYNEQLNELWLEEYTRWSNTVEGFLEPLFRDDREGFKLAKEAYLTIFPTKQEFENPIRVFVVGPNPVSMEVSDSKEEHSISTAIQEAAVFNTNEVLEAAREGAADRALAKAAELLDDLDVRVSSKVGERQTGGSKRRGSWQITAETLQLITRHCPGFENLSTLSNDLLDVGVRLQSDTAKVKNQAFKDYADLKTKIREELQSIVESRNSSDGLESLKRSLTLSGTYRDLLAKINSADNQDQLDQLYHELQIEKDVYHQRAKHLQTLFDQRAELVKAQSANLDDLIDEVKTIEAESTDDLDF